MSAEPHVLLNSLSQLGQKDKMRGLSYNIKISQIVAATSIKRDPPLKGHIRAPPPPPSLNANAPLLSVHLSNAASGGNNTPQNTEIVSLICHFLWVDNVASLIKFHQLTFLHQLYAWCN